MIGDPAAPLSLPDRTTWSCSLDGSGEAWSVSFPWGCLALAAPDEEANPAATAAIAMAAMAGNGTRARRI